MDDWLKIPDETVDTAQIQREIERRLAEMIVDTEKPEAVMRELRQQMLGEPGNETDLPPLYEADIVPRDYAITWHNPIWGPLNAILRRFVNLELRRSIYPTLERQSTLNRQMLQALMRLRAENESLRRQIESLRREK